MPDAPTGRRVLPALTATNRTYWTSGADEVWRLQRCPECARLIHPPALRCQYDQATPIWERLSGRGTVESWTVNTHPFFPGIPTPYVIAFVNPIEDVRARVLTNLVDVDIDQIHVGMPVQVVFERHSDGDGADDADDVVYLPLFTPQR